MTQPVEFDPDAYEALIVLQQQDPETARSIDRIIDDLEESPDTPYLKRHYLRPPGLYKVPVHTPAGHRDYMLLWDKDGDTIVVRYVGPGFSEL